MLPQLIFFLGFAAVLGRGHIHPHGKTAVDFEVRVESPAAMRLSLFVPVIGGLSNRCQRIDHAPIDGRQHVLQMFSTDLANRPSLGCQTANDPCQPLGVEHIRCLGKRTERSATYPPIPLGRFELRSLLQSPQRANHRMEEIQQDQQAILVIMQLAVSRPVSRTADLMQFGQQGPKLLQVFESLNILAAKHFPRLDHNPTPSNWPTKN